jgi:WD40 repeat protein/serine/threonine protein kinase
MALDSQRAKSVFLAAAGRPAEERAAFLDEACAGEAELRRRVEQLLAAHDRPDSLPEAPPDAGPTRGSAPEEGRAPAGPAEGPGTVIGPYKLLQQLGEGGMGTVYLAEQSRPVRRMVALKIIKPGMDTRQVLARFEAERQALALMDHPHIARVLEGGTTDSGRPYFIMELVKGVPITRYCDERRLSPRQRLELFVPVCQAVQHAHQKGVIHRDLKPSNVLVCLYDGRPVPKVIDFGIAKAAGQQLTERTLFTEVGQVVGTLEYMSPEQAEVNQLDIDTRSDIYSLGVLLYELLTGSTPLERKRLKSVALLEVLRLIREEEPPRPSTRLSESKDTLASISAQRQTEPARLAKLVRGELDWIVMKALEKDRGRRYETANGFAADVQRYLADEPVLACPPSASYRLRKFVRRHRGPVLAAAVILLLLLGGIVGTSLGLLQARTSEQRAEGAAIKAGEERDAANEARAAEKLERQRAVDLGKELRRRLYVAQMNQAGQATASPFGLGRVAELLAGWGEGRPDVRGWEWYYLYAQCHQDLLTIPVTSSRVFSVAWSPDGTRLATSQGHIGRPRIWDAATGKEAVVLEWGDINQEVGWDMGPLCIAWSPDGTQLACTYRPAFHGAFAIWDVATGKRCLTIEPRGLALGSIAWAPDSRRLAWGDTGPDIRILDAKTGKLNLTLKGHTRQVWSTAWSHDGTRLASADVQGSLKIWDVASGTVALDITVQPWARVSWSPDDSRLASAGAGDLVQILDTATGKQLGVNHFNTRQSQSVAWSPDGTRLALGTDQGEVKITDAATAKFLFALRGHTGEVRCVAWSPDGKRLASTSDDGTVKVWDANHPDGLPVVFAKGWIEARDVSWSPDGKRLASGGNRGGNVTIWNVAARSGTTTLHDPVTLRESNAAGATTVSWKPDGTRLASADAAGIFIWDAATGKELRTLRGHGMQSLAWSPDGTRLASSAPGGRVIIWDPAAGEQIRTLIPNNLPANTVSSVAWSPDGTRLAAACGRVVIWDTSTGLSTRVFEGHGSSVNWVAWCPTGTRLASVGWWDRAIHVWDASTGRVFCTLKGHTDFVHMFSWSPDGKRLASCSNDGTLKLWDPTTGEVVVTLPNGAAPRCLAWSPDGSRLAVGDAHAIRCLAAAPGYRLAGRPGAGKQE